MKTILVLLALSFALGSCAAHKPMRYVYRESQFANRLEYLRFCQRYELLTYRCID
jgi:hypothetical protein